MVSCIISKSDEMSLEFFEADLYQLLALINVSQPEKVVFFFLFFQVLDI